jgi:hypothetical protein
MDAKKVIACMEKMDGFQESYLLDIASDKICSDEFRLAAALLLCTCDSNERIQSYKGITPMVTTLLNTTTLNLVVGRQPVKTTAYIMYKGERVDVTVKSIFRGADGLMANVEALNGYPFLSSEVNSQGKTFGAWNCNGYRVRTDFVYVEVVHDPEDYQPHPVYHAQQVEREIENSEWEAEMTARHNEWLDWDATRESDRPQ